MVNIYKEADAKIAEAFRRGKENIVTFNRLFLPIEDEVEPAWFHYLWSDILLNGDKHFAVEGFRESAKSTFVLRAFPLYRLTYPTKKANYIVFIMANQTKASKQLKEIADTYVSKALSDCCLTLTKLRLRNSFDTAFECVVTDENGEEIRVRMEAYGKGSSIRGLLWGDKRPDIIIIDDPQDVEDSLSDTIQTNDYDWFLSDAYFLGKRTRIFMIGNNLGEKCLIEQVINNKDLLKFNALRIPVMNENGESNWAERFPVEEILEDRKSVV